MALAIFDIDGTLADLFAVHVAVYKKALKAIYGVEGSLFDIKSFSGMPYTDIVKLIAEQKGVDKHVIAAKAGMIPAAFRQLMESGLDNGSVKVLPGVKGLLRGLEKAGCLVAVISGNSRKNSEAILGKAGLQNYFIANAFGDEAGNRGGVLNLAIERVQQQTGKCMQRSAVCVIDDSVRGIAAGKAIGIRAIAVATGPESYAELEAAKPDAIFKDLTDTEKVLRAIHG
ncbi:MAG: HAD family phosphatase [Candidatus Aenigmarchaeota archaeon]|nr:HAD family phosphatase [Candidatus Aenigmarchaeota archaeon]